MDDEDQPYDARSAAVAAAQAELEVARRSGRSGAIALAHFNLAAVLALAGDHASATSQYRELVDYLDLASGDQEAENERWLRMISPAAPPPTASDVDPVQLQAFARVELAKSLLVLGRREEAARELELAAAAARGFGRGSLRRRIREVQARMSSATAAHHPSADAGHGRGPARRGGSAGTRVGPAEGVAAADELLGQGRHAEAARVALGAIAQCGEGDVLTRARGRQVLGMALDEMGQPDDAFSVLRESYSDYVQADQHEAAANVVVALAWRRAEQGDRATAAELLRGALDAIGGRAGATLRVRLLTDLGSLQDAGGEHAEARRTFSAALETARTTADSELVADAQHGLAVVLATHGGGAEDAVEALSLLDDCRRRYESAGLLDRAAGCEHEAAALLGRLGSYEAAATRYRQALDRYLDLSRSTEGGAAPAEIADCEHNLRALAAHAIAPAGGSRHATAGAPAAGPGTEAPHAGGADAAGRDGAALGSSGDVVAPQPAAAGPEDAAFAPRPTEGGVGAPLESDPTLFRSGGHAMDHSSG